MNFEIIKDKDSNKLDEKLEILTDKPGFTVHGFGVDREGFYCVLVSWKEQ